MGWPQGWTEWTSAISFVVTLVGLPLAGLGLLHTIRQVQGAKSAAEATEAAVDAMSRHASASRLMVNLTLLRQIEADLRETRRDGDLRGASRALNRWRTTAPALRAAIDLVAPLDLREALTASMELARVAEEKVEELSGDAAAAQDPQAALVKVTRQATRTISRVTDELTNLAEQRAALPPDGIPGLEADTPTNITGTDHHEDETSG